MFTDDHVLLMIAKAHHKELLAEAEKERMARLVLSGRPAQKSALDRVVGWIRLRAARMFSWLNVMSSARQFTCAVCVQTCSLPQCCCGSSLA